MGKPFHTNQFIKINGIEIGEGRFGEIISSCQTYITVLYPNGSKGIYTTDYIGKAGYELSDERK